MQPSALVRLFELECVPALHGSAALAPAGQYEPASQGAHVCWPPLSWYVPAAQLTHTPLPPAGCTVPGLHFVCLVLPVGAK